MRKGKNIPNSQVISRHTTPCRSIHRPYAWQLTQDFVRTRQDPWSGFPLFQVIARPACDIEQVVCFIVVADSATSCYVIGDPIAPRIAGAACGIIVWKPMKEGYKSMLNLDAMIGGIIGD